MLEMRLSSCLAKHWVDIVRTVKHCKSQLQQNLPWRNLLSLCPKKLLTLVFAKMCPLYFAVVSAWLTFIFLLILSESHAFWSQGDYIWIPGEQKSRTFRLLNKYALTSCQSFLMPSNFHGIKTVTLTQVISFILKHWGACSQFSYHSFFLRDLNPTVNPWVQSDNLWYKLTHSSVNFLCPQPREIREVCQGHVSSKNIFPNSVFTVSLSFLSFLLSQSLAVWFFIQ